MSHNTPTCGLWSYQETGGRHEYKWQPMTPISYITYEERAFARITSPGVLYGIVAISGWSNDYGQNHHVLNNRQMIEEAEEFAQAIDFVGPYRSWRPCHVEMQLITFYVNFVTKFPGAFDYVQSRQGSISNSTKKFEICVSRKVCDQCHEFVTRAYLAKGVEVYFFVDNIPDYPCCQKCRANIVGYRAFHCWACQAKLIDTAKAAEYRRLTLDDICKLKKGLRLYIRGTHMGGPFQQKGCDDLQRIEADSAFGLTYYSKNSSWINSHLRRCNYNDLFEHLNCIEFDDETENENYEESEDDDGDDDGDDENDDDDDDDDNNHEHRNEDDTVISLNQHIAALNLSSAHDSVKCSNPRTSELANTIEECIEKIIAEDGLDEQPDLRARARRAIFGFIKSLELPELSAAIGEFDNFPWDEVVPVTKETSPDKQGITSLDDLPLRLGQLLVDDHISTPSMPPFWDDLGDSSDEVNYYFEDEPGWGDTDDEVEEANAADDDIKIIEGDW